MKIRHNLWHAPRTWGLTALMGLVMAATVARSAINVLEFTGDPQAAEPLSASEAVELDALLTLDGDFTVEYWVNTARADAWRLFNRSGISSASFRDAISHTVADEISLYGPRRHFALREAFAVDAWEHVAITREDQFVRVYRNGVSVEAVVDFWEGAIRLDRIGGRSNATSAALRYVAFEGRVAEIRVWDHARDAQAITEFLNVRLSDQEHGLIGYWPLDEGAGSTVSDLTGGGADGQIVHAAWTTTDSLSFASDAGFVAIAPLTLVNPETGSTRFTNSDNVETADWTLPDGYDQYQLTVAGDPASIDPGAWTPTDTPPPGVLSFDLPAADTNIHFFVWYTNSADSVTLKRSRGSILYTTVQPEPVVFSSWALTAEDGLCQVSPEALDDGSTGGNYAIYTLDIVARRVRVASGPHADQTPAETYASLPPGTYLLELEITNEAGNVAVSAPVPVTILPSTGPVSASGGDVVTNYVQNGVTYRAHLFLSPVLATLDDALAELDAATDVVDGVTVTDGMVVYVENAANAEQVGRTFQARGVPGDWTWTFYGLEVGQGGDIEYLVVGGGGGGGASSPHLPGGGGAGGYRSAVEGEPSGGNTPTGPQLAVVPSGYPVRVGVGGLGAASGTGLSGGESQFAAIVSIGGGGSGVNGLDGGSGGGAMGGNPDSNYRFGFGVPGQGHAGGYGFDSGSAPSRGGGGGGGAGGVGQDGANNNGGDGGEGLYSAIAGVLRPYAGGGGGGGLTVGLGGSGIGGDGSSRRDENSIATSGVENTGSGGGAGNLDHPGGNGGAGIVVVRYEYFPGTIILVR